MFSIFSSSSSAICSTDLFLLSVLPKLSYFTNQYTIIAITTPISYLLYFKGFLFPFIYILALFLVSNFFYGTDLVRCFSWLISAITLLYFSCSSTALSVDDVHVLLNVPTPLPCSAVLLMSSM